MEFKDALLLVYVIMFAPFFENLFSCDLQRMFSRSIVAKHILAVISIMFLITLVDYKNDIKSLGEMFKMTGIIYGLYIFSIKSKAYFVLPMLVSLLADQLMKVQIEILNKREKEEPAREGDAKMKTRLIKAREAMTWVIVFIIFAGMASYYVRARIEFGDKFSTTAFFLGTKRCAHGPMRFA